MPEATSVQLVSEINEAKSNNFYIISSLNSISNGNLKNPVTGKVMNSLLESDSISTTFYSEEEVHSNKLSKNYSCRFYKIQRPK